MSGVKGDRESGIAGHPYSRNLYDNYQAEVNDERHSWSMVDCQTTFQVTS